MQLVLAALKRKHAMYFSTNWPHTQDTQADTEFEPKRGEPVALRYLIVAIALVALLAGLAAVLPFY